MEVVLKDLSAHVVSGAGYIVKPAPFPIPGFARAEKGLLAAEDEGCIGPDWSVIVWMYVLVWA